MRDVGREGGACGAAQVPATLMSVSVILDFNLSLRQRSQTCRNSDKGTDLPRYLLRSVHVVGTENSLFGRVDEYITWSLITFDFPKLGENKMGQI